MSRATTISGPGSGTAPNPFFDNRGTLRKTAGSGVSIANGATGNTLGGATAPAQNVIAFNESGISIEAGAIASTTSVQRNSIHGNTGLGIDIGTAGVTPNDPGDTDGIPNIPVIESAVISGGNLTIRGFRGTARSFELYLADPDPSGVLAGTKLTATAIGSISEFSGNVTATAFTNDAPTLGTIPDKTVYEGHTLSFQVLASDPNPGDTLTYSLVSAPSGATINPLTGVFTWVAPDNTTLVNSSVSVTVRVTDTGVPPGSADATFEIEVANIPPTIAVTDVTLSPAVIFEHDLLTVVGTFTDSGSEQHFIDVYWGDGTKTRVDTLEGEFSFSASHRYPDDALTAAGTDIYALRVEISDADIAGVLVDPVVLTGLTVAVHNVPPSIVDSDLSLSATAISEGGQITLAGSFTDIGALDTHTVTIDWGDGTPPTVLPFLAHEPKEFTALHTYADDRPSGTAEDDYQIRVTVTDDDSGTNLASATVTVANVGAQLLAPYFTVGTCLDLPVTTVDENGLVILCGQIADPGTSDRYTLEINWGDGSVVQNVSLPPGTTSYAVAHRYLDDGDPEATAPTSSTVYPVSVALRDDDSGEHTDTTSLTVHNVEPTLVTSSLTLHDPVSDVPIAAVSEGQSIRLRGSFADPGTVDRHEVEISWGDGSPSTILQLDAGVLTFDAIHLYADDRPSGTPSDTMTIQVTVRDDDTGSSGSVGNSLTVNNVFPTVSILPVPAGAAGQIEFTTVVIDPGVDTWTYQWSVTADGSPVSIPAGDADGATFVFTLAPGPKYIVRVDVTDDDSGTASGQVIPVTANSANNHIVVTASGVEVDGVEVLQLASGDPDLVIFALDGDDTIDASNSPVGVAASGGRGHDTFYGSRNNDTFVLKDGDDTVASHSAGDQARDDTFYIVCCSEISITDSVDVNTLNFSLNAFGITFDLNLTQGQPQELNSTVHAGGTVAVTGKFDRLVGTSQPDTLYAARGVFDTETLQFEGSTILAGDGNDHVFAGLGSFVDLGRGADVFDDMTSLDDLIPLLGGFGNLPIAGLLGGFATRVVMGEGADTAKGRFLTRIDLGSGSDHFEESVPITDLIELVGGFGDTLDPGEIVELPGGFGSVVNLGEGDDTATARFLARIDLGDGDDRFDDMTTTTDLIELLGGFGDDGGVFSDLLGQVVAYYANSLGGYSDDEFELGDSIILDLELPADGTYFVEVDTFHFGLPEFAAYRPAGFDVIATCDALNNPDYGDSEFACEDTDVGDYELFLYRFDAGFGDDGDDVITSNSGDDLLEGGAGDDLFIVSRPAGSTDRVTVYGGGGDDRLDMANSTGGSVNFADQEPADSVMNTSFEIFARGLPVTLEGAVYTIQLFVDASAAAVDFWTIDWGDGSIPQVVNGIAMDATHTYADGTIDRTILVTATRGTATSAAAPLAVRVPNAAPVLTISGAAAVDEGGAYLLQLAASDIGPDTITDWYINWGDGSPIQRVPVPVPPSVAHVYADGNASPVITATATDEDGTFASNELRIAVRDIAPDVTITGSNSIGETALYTLGLSAVDSGPDTVELWFIDWGDGSDPDADGVPGERILGNPGSVTHRFADGHVPGTAASIKAWATNENGSYPSAPLIVTVLDIAPVVTISGEPTVLEGTPYTLALSAIDPGADTIGWWFIDWGDGSDPDNGTVVGEFLTGNPASVVHTYADGSNDYEITATATNEDGSFASNILDVMVMDKAPLLTIRGANRVDEGSVYTLNLSVEDSGGDAITSWTIQWGDGPPEVVTGNCDLTFNPGTYIITSGGLTISGHADVIGSGVTIYNAGAGAITVSGKGTFNLTPPSTGTYAGVTFFQARTNTKQVSLSGNASGMKGTLYAPAAQLSLSGNGDLQMTLIVDRLRMSGNASTALVNATGAADVDATAIASAGQLNTGVHRVAILDDSGTASPDQLARIRDSIATIHSAFGAYGVRLVEVDAASRGAADIRIITGDSSPCGGPSDGVLGCTTAWGEITLIQGWNWYTGIDSTAVGGQQYDYQTIVTHELGHSIGIDHSSDSASTMYARLTTGVARRGFTVHDLAHLADAHGGGDHADRLTEALRVSLPPGTPATAEARQSIRPDLARDGAPVLSTPWSIAPPSAVPGVRVIRALQGSDLAISARAITPRHALLDQVLGDETLDWGRAPLTRVGEALIQAARTGPHEQPAQQAMLPPTIDRLMEADGSGLEDMLVGESGDDRVLGESGSDVLTGGIRFVR